MRMDKVANGQAKWYAVYTRSRAEKKLYTLLTQKNVECFLPLQKILKQRSDRKKWVEEPLLRSYVFVRIQEQEYFNVLNTAGAVHYVCFEGKAVPIPDNQIHALESLIHSGIHQVEVSYEELSPGEVVEVTGGPLKGTYGEIQQLRGKHRLILRFESMGLCLHTEVSLKDVKITENKQLTA